MQYIWKALSDMDGSWGGYVAASSQPKVVWLATGTGQGILAHFKISPRMSPSFGHIFQFFTLEPP